MTSPRRSFRIPIVTLIDYLSALARDHGEKAALLFKGTTVSYGRLDAESTAFASALWSLGVRKGDRVGLLLPNCPQFLIAEFGVWKIGAVVVCVNPTYTERELEQMLAAVRVQTIVTLTPFYERVKRVQERVGVRHVIATSIKEYLPPMLRALFTLFKERKSGHRIHLASGDLWMDDLIRKHRAAHDRRLRWARAIRR